MRHTPLTQYLSLSLDDNRRPEIQYSEKSHFDTLEWEGFMPISDCEVRDPRIRRTRQLLQGALRTLMLTKLFEEISVQDIAEAATVNRATFYDHYADKFALLDALAAGEFHMLLHERQVRYDGTCPAAASAIIRATCDYLVQMHEGRKECSTQRSATGALVDAAIIAAIHLVLTAKAGHDAPPFSGIAATAASWAIYGAARAWFFTPNHPPAGEIVPHILALVLPILQNSQVTELAESAHAR
jgi:AcrR family transcriptional regulator